MFWKGVDSLKALKICRKHEIGDERKLFLSKRKRKCSISKQILVSAKLALNKMCKCHEVSKSLLLISMMAG